MTSHRIRSLNLRISAKICGPILALLLAVACDRFLRFAFAPSRKSSWFAFGLVFAFVFLTLFRRTLSVLRFLSSVACPGVPWVLKVFAVLVFAFPAWSQQCTSYIVVNAFDHKLHIDIETLKTQDFEAKMGGTSLEIVSLDQDYNSRLLVLLEMDGITSKKIQDNIDTVISMVREAPEGRPVAFGIMPSMQYSPKLLPAILNRG